MIGSRLRSEIVDACGVLVLCCVVGVACNTNESLTAVGREKETGRSILTYYGEMWFRTWQAPLIAVLTGTAALTMMLFSFGTTGIQAAGDYYKQGQAKEEKQEPVTIDGYIESYGDPPRRHWLWG